MTTLVLEFKKIKSEDETKKSIFYSNSKTEMFFNETDIDDVFESVYIKIISYIQTYLGKALGWISDSVIDHTLNVWK